MFRVCPFALASGYVIESGHASINRVAVLSSKRWGGRVRIGVYGSRLLATRRAVVAVGIP